jgi:hypothetical protein
MSKAKNVRVHITAMQILKVAQLLDRLTTKNAVTGQREYIDGMSDDRLADMVPNVRSHQVCRVRRQMDEESAIPKPKAQPATAKSLAQEIGEALIENRVAALEAYLNYLEPKWRSHT